MERPKLKKPMSLKIQIMLLSIGVVLASILTISYGFIQTMEKNLSREVESNVLNTARMVASMPSVVEAFGEDRPEEIIDPLMKTIRHNTRDIEFIVVTDMDGIRYSHPNPDRVLQRFVGGDEEPALREGKEYVSVARGTLGVSTRGFSPLHDEDGTQLGMVTVGILNQNIESAMAESRNQAYQFAFFGSVIGILGSLYLAHSIKESLMGLEPHQISKLLKERNGILKAIKEGIIAIDSGERVSMINETARKMLEISDDKVEGMHISEVLPDSKMPRVLKTGIAELDHQDVMNGIPIMANRIPIMNKKEIVGVITSFREKDELTNLAEELTGAKMLVDSLRAHSHEFMSKLHVLLGLLQLKEYAMAENYIIDTTDTQQKITSLVMNRIKDPGVAALLIGKHSVAKEMEIEMEIDENSSITKLQGRITSSALITIIGNLINNAFDAVARLENPKVSVGIREYPDSLLIRVQDNGSGILKDDQSHIFQKGFSTRSENRGTGLFLVRQTVDILNGKIRFDTRKNKGTVFWVRLPLHKNLTKATLEAEEV